MAGSLARARLAAACGCMLLSAACGLDAEVAPAQDRSGGSNSSGGATPGSSSGSAGTSSSGGASSGGNSSGGSSSGGSSSGATSSSGSSSGSGTIRVAISPASVSLPPGGSQRFACSVSGTANTTCTWAVREGAAAGSVDAAGLYRAPATAGVYHVVATSQADGAASDTATATVREPGTCTDACPAPNAGVTWDCRKRFMYGMNWAWGEWGADFGGIAAWKKGGVKARSAAFDADMKSMKAAGVSVIRWWMFPRFLTDAIQWGADGSPSGIGGTLLEDVQEALRLAEANDLYVMLTPFSFDNFRPASSDGSPGLRPLVVNASLRRSLLDNLVKPVARAVEASPYKKRMIAWDLMNEPEWAVSGESLYGDPRFEPSSKVEAVTHAELQTFLQEMAALLRAHSTALLTVGGAAIKWPKAWSRVDVDFYQYHYYDWVYEWFPYTTVTPASVGMGDKPVVIGEFPAAGLSAMGGHPARTAAEFSADLWSLGYAGALAWAFNDPQFPWSPGAIRPLHDQHACETAY